jgi:uncharacterized membrane protein
MQLVTLYATTAAVFLILDGLMLTLIMKPLFTRHIGALLIEPIRYVPAGLFYAAYVAGLLYLVSLPALKSGAPILIPAAIIGAMAYGTYEFTSYAILRDWHPAMVATDFLWGTFLTAFSAWAGVTLTRMITG